MNIFSLTFIFLFSFFLFLHPIDADGDFFQHVNIGKYVWQNHALPHFDNLTFSANGKEYVAYAWLSGSIFYLIYYTFGSIGINILVLGVAILTFILLYLYLTILKIPGKMALLTIALIAPIMASRWPSRPEIFIYPVFVGFLLIDKVKDSFIWAAYLYPFLMLLLVNLYGSSFPAAAIILILIFIRNLWQDKFKIEASKQRIYASILICFPLALLNGYGFKSIFFITLIPKMADLWSDWVGIIGLLSAPNFYGFSKQALFFYLIFLAYFVSVVFFSFKKVKSYGFASMLAFGLLIPFLAIRQRSLSAMLSAPLLAYLLTYLKEKTKWLFYLGVLLSLVLILLSIKNSPPGIGGNLKNYPPGLIGFIKGNDLSGRVFNTPRIGSFLEFYLYPQIQTFSDTRDDLFLGTGILETMNQFLAGEASTKFLLQKYKIDIVVASTSDGISFRDLFYDNRWALVYFDSYYFIIIPREVATKKHLTTFGQIDPFSKTGLKSL